MIRRLLVVVVLLSIAGCADWITDIPPYASVEAEAKRLSGDPVPGASLILYIGSRIMGTGVTGADGAFTFKYLPTNAYGVYAEPPDGYVRPEEVLGGPSTSNFVQGLDLPEGGRGVASFTYLKVGPGVIDARVTDQGGAPLASVPTHLYSPSGVSASAVSDGDGRLHFEPVAFGLWGLRFELPEEYLDPGEGSISVDGLLVEEGTVAAVDFKAERCEGSIDVAVLSAVGTPVAGHPVLLYDDKGGTVPGSTEADGVHTFSGLLCGNYGVRLELLPGWIFEDGRGKSYLDGFQLRRGSHFETSFRVTRCEGSLRVRVVDQAGTPVPGAELLVYNSRTAVTSGSSDATGSAVFPGLGCDEYGVKITPPAGYTVPPGRGSSYFDGLFVRDGVEVQVTFRVVAP